LNWDSTELSEICARSLFVRSKPSPARTWSQKWNRDSWTRHLSGRILKPSHGEHFETAWTSSLAVIPASHSPQPASASAPKTPAICGPTSQTEFDFFAPDSASLKMSKDTSPSDSEKSLESWNQSVIKRRGEYSARVKSALRTRESGSSSWPSPVASEVRQGFQDRSRGMKGSQESLTTVVVKDAAMWPTIRVKQAEDCPSERNRRSPSLDSMAKLHGQAAPASPSTDGSRQGLWRTPSVAEEKNQNTSTQIYLQNQVGATPKVWRTPSSSDGEGGVMEMREGCAGKYKLRDHVVAEAKETWWTPQVQDSKHSGTNPSANGQRMLLVNQVNWPTPDTQTGPHGARGVSTNPNHQSAKSLEATARTWATPRPPNGGQTTSGAEQKETKKQVLLQHQTGGKLNPRWVETLMGLPVGWTMPSCKSPVTIAPTNFDSSATESSQQPQRELFEF
jgi:hypothetical protein